MQIIIQGQGIPQEGSTQNVGFRKKNTWGNKTKQLHVMPECLRNEVVTSGAGNILPELPNTAEHDFAWFRMGLLRSPVPCPGSHTRCFPVPRMWGLFMKTCLLGDPQEKIQMEWNLVNKLDGEELILYYY